MKETEYKGVSASSGIAIGRIFKYFESCFSISKQLLQAEETNTHINLFYSGREQTKKQLKRIYKESVSKIGLEKAELFEGYIEILNDKDIENEIIHKIKTNCFSCDRAVDEVFEENIQELETLENVYIRERADDIRSIKKMLLQYIKGVPVNNSLQFLPKEAVVVAIDIEPTDAATMNKENVLGFVMQKGGVTSHVAIMAKSLDIPALININNIFTVARNGDRIILDCDEEKIILHPSQATLQAYQKKISVVKKRKKELSKLKNLPASTLDGYQVKICANIGSPDDLKAVIENGADGIGLFRSEFLFMHSKEMPSEEQQFAVYKKVVESMKDKAVVIRTLDVGGDKKISYINIPKEQNPFLGYRAIRLCLERKDIFFTQLRAILRASHYGKIKILLPMIIALEEIKKVKNMLAQIQAHLQKENINFDKHMQIGIMIETPAAALIADRLIEEVDFFSIGTNDLTQYTLAVDRGNEQVKILYNPFHPAVLSLINHVIQVSHRVGKKTAMCGELASDMRAVKLLLSMGLDEFSVAAPNIHKIKKLIRSCNRQDLKQWPQKILEQSDSEKVLEAMSRFC